MGALSLKLKKNIAPKENPWQKAKPSLLGGGKGLKKEPF